MATQDRHSVNVEDPEELACVLRCARSDPARFSPVYAHYFPRIYGYCFVRLREPVETEDVTSAVFVSALAGLQNYRGGSFTAWLFRIARNAVVSHLRSRQSRDRSIALIHRFQQDSSAVEEQALARILADERRQQILKLVGDLPEDMRELLALKVSGELSTKEISLILGKSEGAIRVALHRLIQRLRVAYSIYEEE